VHKKKRWRKRRTERKPAECRRRCPK
jgi:hypothetical protein